MSNPSIKEGFAGKWTFLYESLNLKQGKVVNSDYNGKSVTKKLRVKLACIYHKAPGCFQRIFRPAQLTLKLIQILRLDVWIITGDEISTGHKLGMLYAGHEFDKKFLASLAFGSSCEHKYLGKVWLWNVPGIVKKTNRGCSLAVTEMPYCLRKLSRKMKSFFIAHLVSGEIAITPDKLSVLTRGNSAIRSDMSKMRKNKLSFKVTSEISDLHEFYHHMYQPYITKVFGDRAFVWSFDFVKKEFGKRGRFNDLLLVKRKDEYIAGALLGYKRNRVKLWAIGVKDANMDYVRERTIGALYYFSVQHAAERGFTMFDFGGSRAFLKDGVLQYKKRYNQRIYDRKEKGFMIKMLSETVGLQGFFLNNPFIYADETGLNGAIFVTSGQSLTKKAFAKIYKDYYMPGLSKLVIYQFGSVNAETQEIIHPEYSDKIIVRSAEDIFFAS